LRLDSQSVKAPAASERGFDDGKKIIGRKRHIAVDGSHHRHRNLPKCGCS
jgi:hypothetical protein